jgi:hypothetical protein
LADAAFATAHPKMLPARRLAAEVERLRILGSATYQTPDIVVERRTSPDLRRVPGPSLALDGTSAGERSAFAANLGAAGPPQFPWLIGMPREFRDVLGSPERWQAFTPSSNLRWAAA